MIVAPAPFLTAQSLRTVDDTIAAVVSRLACRGLLEDTVIMFTSDNGFKLGNHNIAQVRVSLARSNAAARWLEPHVRCSEPAWFEYGQLRGLAGGSFPCGARRCGSGRWTASKPADS